VNYPDTGDRRGTRFKKNFFQHPNLGDRRPGRVTGTGDPPAVELREKKIF
jgi:hypothetical protein